MLKSEIIEKLEANYSALISILETQNDDRFGQPSARGKWTPGQHAEHLVKSTRPLNKALRMPKLALKLTFGTKNERPERSFGEVVDNYQLKLAEGNIVATNPPGSRFAPKGKGEQERREIIKQLSIEFAELKKIIEKWSEPDLTKYIVPHPLLGKMTVREILYFTIYHTARHTAQLSS